MNEQELVDKIKDYNKAYWETCKPLVSDQEYDRLIGVLELCNPSHPLLTKVGHSYDVDVKHNKPMLSLAKVYDHNKLYKWIDKVSRDSGEVFLVQPKYDGIAVKLQKGRLITRGNGLVGKDITDKLSYIDIVTSDTNGLILGELILQDNEFKKLKAFDYHTNRNAVAGLVRLKSNEIFESSGVKLTLVDYNTISYSMKAKEASIRFIELMQELKKYTYPMDGVVIKLADDSYAHSLGYTDHHPKGAIAFKFTDTEYKSQLLDVCWGFGKQNITPVGVIKPIQINNVTISRVTLHNMSFIKEKDIHINDEVVITRAGDVIPNIVRVIPGVDRIKIKLTNCPKCNSKIIQNKELVCSNKTCTGTLIPKLLSNMKILRIKHLGEKVLAKLVDKYNIKNIVDLFDLTLDQYMTIFSEKLSNKFLMEVTKGRFSDYQTLLATLEIVGIGRRIWKKVLAKYNVADIPNLTLDQLREVFGNNKTPDKIFEYISKNQEYIVRLISYKLD